MSALQNLEELFVKYQRLNQILRDNWNDSTQESFDSNYLTPIATEWSQYHTSVSDMKHRVDSTQREIDEVLDEIDRECNSILSENIDCRLNGSCIYGAHFLRNDHSLTKHFIVAQHELNHLDKEDLSSMAISRFPSMDEIEGTFLVEPICIY